MRYVPTEHLVFVPTSLGLLRPADLPQVPVNRTALPLPRVVPGPLCEWSRWGLGPLAVMSKLCATSFRWWTKCWNEIWADLLIINNDMMNIEKWFLLISCITKAKVHVDSVSPQFFPVGRSQTWFVAVLGYRNLLHLLFRSPRRGQVARSI